MTTKNPMKPSTKKSGGKTEGKEPEVNKMMREHDEAANGGQATKGRATEILGDAAAPPDELAKLVAELAAARVEVAALRAQAPTKELTGKQALRAEWRKPVDVATLEPASTLLGKAQRMDRDHLLVSTFKAVRALKWSQLPEVFAYLVTRCAEDGGEVGEDTIEKLFGEFTSKRVVKAKEA